MDKHGPKVVVIGGGTGSFTLLSALKEHTDNITAIVNMADDGGSTGVLRDELGALPPGDVRQCLVALSESAKIRELFNYRFTEGTFSGHSFGNLLLTALEKVSGNFSDAVETASEILNIKGTVLPATLDNVRLRMEWPDDEKLTLHGERVIDEYYFRKDPRTAMLSLLPTAQANPQAIRAIKEADIVVIAPGDLYTSLGPLLIIDEIGRALQSTKATVVYVSNLVTKKGQTEGFTVSDHAAEIERFIGVHVLDYVLYNASKPNEQLAKIYREEENAYIVDVDTDRLQRQHYQAIGGDFLGDMAKGQDGSEHLPVAKRSLIRHDAEATAAEIMTIFKGAHDSKD
jgi:uncharacterized cofD-like protein